MKKTLIEHPAVKLLFFMLVSFGFSHPGKSLPVKKASAKSVVVVELFTSEGCSSCPPADAAVADLANDYPNDVLVLGFHVDYWNYLGWKDVFSNPAYSKRQEAYAAVFSLNSIYTPQVVINGETQFTGSEKTRLFSKVADALQKPPVSTITAAAKLQSADIQVSYETNAGNQSVVNVALVQLHAASSVTKGENRGLQLQHINIVRDFATAGGSKGSLQLHLPQGLAASNCRVFVFVQRTADMHITGATACSIQ